MIPRPPTPIASNALNVPLVETAMGAEIRGVDLAHLTDDNRICVHQAFNEYDDFRRELYRTTIAGEAPI